MKTIFDEATRQELIVRINTLNADSAAQWGKMSIFQMVKHCRLWQEMILGKIQCKRVFIGRLFGKIALWQALKDDKPMVRNAPTSPDLRVIERNGDIASEKAKWIELIKEHAGVVNTDFVHPFFGKMTKEQLGYHAYKHIDHHLRQFNG